MWFSSATRSEKVFYGAEKQNREICAEIRHFVDKKNINKV
jgi:hypothetical protein